MSVLPGGAFVLDGPTDIRAVWGRDGEVLWAHGEALMIAGPQGTGKSTVAQQLVRARMGLDDGLLGFPIEPDDRPVLYLACDRPAQIARSMRRIFTEADRDILDERLRVVRGLLPFDLVRAPHKLAELVTKANAGTLVIDSLKDIAPELASEQSGGAVSRAVQGVLEAGCQVVEVHHHRKANADNKKPSKLSDVYGSVWLTASVGSVLVLWGEAGDPLVDAIHVKQPAEEVGPLQLEHDHRHGRTTVRATPNAENLLERSGPHGITAAEVAHAVYGREPTRSEVEKQRRQLEKLTANGHATRHPATTAGAPTRYVPVRHREGKREGSRQGHDPHETPPTLVTQPHAQQTLTNPLKERGSREGWSDDELQALVASEQGGVA